MAEQPSEPLARIELLQGTLDLIILQTLRWGPRHGYGISKMIQATSDGLLQVETGSLYPALHRLERQGWVDATWTISEKNQRVREYSLTTKGHRQLARERARWNHMSSAMVKILGTPEEGTA